ncbi:MAG: hypothetical protein JNM46_07775 [Anaerolineales bacterium]|nr:hypothetical protein [Anaerolineales bacterium]
MRRVIPLILIFVLLIACAPQTESANATPLASGATALPTQSESIFSPSATLLWTEVRDERFGFGFAMPCWWQFTEMPAEGILSTMTIRNYDDNFFIRNSEEGVWKGGRPPQGVMSMDITVATGIDPTLSMVDAYLTLVDTATYSVLSTQEKNISDRVYTVVALKNQINPSEQASVVYLKGLTPDSILIFSTYPTEAIFSNDAQVIFGSFASVQDEAVILPEVLPAPALINLACPF